MLQERLKASELQAIYDSIEMPMIAVLAHMEYEVLVFLKSNYKH